MPIPSMSNEEHTVGIEVYYTDTVGCKGKLRITPSEFKVVEIPLPIKREREGGKFTVIKIQSLDWDTYKLVIYLARKLKISSYQLTFAGTKDKRALTTQIFTARLKLAPESIVAINSESVKVLDYWYSNKMMKIGDLIGNKFEIVLRNTVFSGDELRDALIATTSALVSIPDKKVVAMTVGVPNFFGVQRFGIYKPTTQLIGKALIQGDFRQAVLLYLANPVDTELEKLIMKEDFETVYELYPKTFYYERQILKYLLTKPENYINALLKLPANLRRLLVHAYQSYIFNRILSLRLKTGYRLDRPELGDIILPLTKYNLPDCTRYIKVTRANYDRMVELVQRCKAYISGLVPGYDSSIATAVDGIQAELEHKILELENLELSDFKIGELPSLSTPGTRRNLLAPVFNLKFKLLDSDDNKNAVRFNFELLKGSYATTVLREYMKSETIRAY